MPRLSFFTAFAVVLLAAIYLLAPQQLPVVLYKLALVTLAVPFGYWADRHLFRHRIPRNGYIEIALINAAWYRRAVIVGAAMISFALAL